MDDRLTGQNLIPLRPPRKAIRIRWSRRDLTQSLAGGLLREETKEDLATPALVSWKKGKQELSNRFPPFLLPPIFPRKLLTPLLWISWIPALYLTMLETLIVSFVSYSSCSLSICYIIHAFVLSSFHLPGQDPDSLFSQSFNLFLFFICLQPLLCVLPFPFVFIRAFPFLSFNNSLLFARVRQYR